MTDFSFFVSQRLRSKAGSSFSALIAKVAVGSVALSLTTIILTSIIFNGFTDTIREKIFSFAGHIQINSYAGLNGFEETPASTNIPIYQERDKFPEVAHIQQFAHKAGILKTKTEVAGVVLKGVAHDFDTTRFAKNLIAGRFIAVGQEKYSNEILISQASSNKLNLSIGDKATIYFVQDPPRYRPIEVVGIYETGIEDFDELFMIGDIRMIKKLNNWPDSLAGGFEIFVNDFNKLDHAFEYINKEIGFSLFATKVNSNDKFTHLFDWFVVIKQNATIFLAIILSVAVINILTIILIMILERTEMIGTLKGLGATDWQIQKIFVFNGFKLIVQGLFFGNLVSLGFGVLQQQFKLIPLDPTNYYMDSVPVLFDWVTIVGFNLLAFIVIAAITYIPTLIITRIDPVKSIKFD
ncbi:MAG: ABC transporter permease [Flammeovirgaceae bacterium]